MPTFKCSRCSENGGSCFLHTDEPTAAPKRCPWQGDEADWEEVE